MLVLAGLGTTADQARRMSLTRGLTIHPIGALETDDVTALMSGFCRHFGMEPRGHEKRLARLATPCQGWPRHLHFAMRALGSEAVKTGGDLARVDWARTGRWAHWSRIDYYDAQTSREISAAIHVVEAVVTLMDPELGAQGNDVEETITRAASDQKGHRLPTGWDAVRLRTHLVHQGVLDEHADGTYRCAIPSFASYLACRARTPGPPSDEAIRHARADRSVWSTAVAAHERALMDKDRAIATAREDLARAEKAFRAARPLALFRKRRLDTARRAAADVQDRLEAERQQMTPPTAPPAALLNAATLRTVAEQEAEHAQAACARLVEAGVLEIATAPPPGGAPPRIVITDPAHRSGSREAATGGVDWSAADSEDRARSTLLLWDGTDPAPVQALARLPPAAPLVPATDAVRAALAVVEGVPMADQATVETALRQTHHRERINWVEACRTRPCGSPGPGVRSTPRMPPSRNGRKISSRPGPTSCSRAVLRPCGTPSRPTMRM